MIAFGEKTKQTRLGKLVRVGQNNSWQLGLIILELLVGSGEQDIDFKRKKKAIEDIGFKRKR